MGTTTKPISADMIAAALRSGDPVVRRVAFEVMKRRLEHADEARAATEGPIVLGVVQARTPEREPVYFGRVGDLAPRPVPKRTR